MKVILQKDVKDVGKVGDVVNVAQGFARNFLFPRRLALMATEGKIKEWNHLQKLTELKKKKAVDERKQVIDKVNGANVSFSVQAGEDNQMFGSVTTLDVSKELEKNGFSIDKKDIVMEPIKMIGQHKATVKLGEGLEAEVVVTVEKA